MLLPRVTQAQNEYGVKTPGLVNDAQKGTQEFGKNFFKRVRDDEKRMKDLFVFETNPRSVSITGVVTTTNNLLLRVIVANGKEYLVDATNATITRYSGATINLSEVALQDKLVIRGLLEGNTITATSIRDVSLRVKSVQFYGSIVSLDANANTFMFKTEKDGQKTVQLSATTSIKRNGVPVNFSDLVVGQQVYVTGSWNVRTSVIAAAVVEIIHRWSPVFVQGNIMSKTDTMLTIKRSNGTVYSLDISQGMLLSRFYNPLTSANLNIGDIVTVGGIHLNDSTEVRAFIVRDSMNYSSAL